MIRWSSAHLPRSEAPPGKTDRGTVCRRETRVKKYLSSKYTRTKPNTSERGIRLPCYSPVVHRWAISWWEQLIIMHYPCTSRFSIYRLCCSSSRRNRSTHLPQMYNSNDTIRQSTTSTIVSTNSSASSSPGARRVEQHQTCHRGQDRCPD